uniref:Uncharacterized protein n=1 Tax=Rousettus aegyptiacus TaxID=9407 RepID=A0A7J8DHU2_ROUAE|nr:hypothetical protein HJG63_008562 [Rousettus aegyptiacus]
MTSLLRPQQKQMPCSLGSRKRWPWDPDHVHLSSSPSIPSVFTDRLECCGRSPCCCPFVKMSRGQTCCGRRLGIPVTSSPVDPGRISFVLIYPPLSRLIHSHHTQPRWDSCYKERSIPLFFFFFFWF